MDFTYKAYEKMVTLLRKNGYVFSKYKDNRMPNLKTVIMRHDVDMDLNKALRMAVFENQLGITSTYYVLISSDFYNAFSKNSVNIMKQIMNLGHDIGLHFDEQKYEREDDLLKCLDSEIDLLEKYIGKKIDSVSMHRPSKDTLDADWVIRNGSVVNSYSKEFFQEFKYVSDSRCNWREDIYKIIESGEFNRLHILTHPIWYSEKPRSMNETLKMFVSDAGIERYETLQDNIKDLDSELTLRQAHLLPTAMSQICDKIFDSNRLEFTPISLEDVKEIYEYGKDSNTCRYLGWGPYKNETEAENFVKYKIAADDMQWTIKENSLNKVIGAIRLYDVDKIQRCVSISYILNKQYCGKGYMTESLKALFTVAEKLGFEYVYTYYVEDNIASEKVMRNASMVKDVDYSEKIYVKGKMYREYRYYMRLGESR